VPVRTPLKTTLSGASAGEVSQSCLIARHLKLLLPYLNLSDSSKTSMSSNPSSNIPRPWLPSSNSFFVHSYVSGIKSSRVQAHEEVELVVRPFLPTNCHSAQRILILGRDLRTEQFVITSVCIACRDCVYVSHVPPYDTTPFCLSHSSRAPIFLPQSQHPSCINPFH